MNTLNRDSLEYLLQLDLREFIENCFKGRQWLPVDFSVQDGQDDLAIFGELVPNELVEDCLSSTGWDLAKDHIGPACSVVLEEGEEVVSYSRLDTFNDIEPIVIPRWFYNIMPSYRDLLEEYCLFHNLYHDFKKNEYLKLDNAGNTEVVARLVHDEFQLKRKYLRQYLGIKDMSLIIQFGCFRYSPIEISDIPEEDRNYSSSRDNHILEVSVHENNMMIRKDSKTLSSLRGKCVIRGYMKEECDFWPYEKNEDNYQEYIIGLDKEDKHVLASCDPVKLDRSSPEAQSYLTPVFFRSDVLQKYYADESRYLHIPAKPATCSGLNLPPVPVQTCRSFRPNLPLKILSILSLNAITLRY